MARNVLGGVLQPCSYDPLTGFVRDGCCDAHDADIGLHVVCVRVTQAFLDDSKKFGNDLVTPRPAIRFRGLRPGDRWCVCASRWLQAWRAGVAPPVVLEATHQRALEVIPLEALQAHAYVAARRSERG